MRRILKNFRKYFLFLFMMISLILFSACNGFAPDPPVIHFFTAEDSNIDEGASTSLSWSVTDADTVIINQGIGTVTATGTISVSPTVTTTYTMAATNSASSDTASVTVAVKPAFSTYTLTSVAGKGGQIDPEGMISVNKGDSQTFTITPDGCHQIDQVLVDGLSEGPISTYTFSDVQQDHTISASFVFPSRRVYNANTGMEYEIIQQAIDAAQDGEIIIVCPGTYQENIEFDSRNIIVQSADPLDPEIVSVTIIDGNSSDSVVRFMNDTSTLKGFTIQKGNAPYGGGIYVDEGSPVIEKNLIISNHATVYGGGIFIYKGSPMIISNSIISNVANTNGGGIYIDSLSSPTIGGSNVDDTDRFNTVCDNHPNQIEPDVYHNNHISNSCIVAGKCN